MSTEIPVSSGRTTLTEVALGVHESLLNELLFGLFCLRSESFAVTQETVHSAGHGLRRINFIAIFTITISRRALRLRVILLICRFMWID